jgi:hypothetical protein
MRKLPLLLLPAGLLSVVLLAAPPAPPLREKDRPLLPRPGLLRTLFKSQLGLVADYYWILTLNRIGAASTPAEYRDVYYYADLTTDLDPRFRYPYLFGGIATAVHVRAGRYANTAESTQLLRKGVANLPDDAQLKFQLAHNLMYFEKKYKEAADIIQELAQRPGAPDWYGALATRLYAQAGDFNASVTLTLALRDNAEDEETRAFYDQRLREIAQEQALRVLDAAISRYQQREGKLPDALEALVATGDLNELPEDPLGGRFYLAQDGRSYSTASKFRLELIHDEKTATGERVFPKPK